MRKYRILVVDDLISSIQLVSSILEAQNYEIFYAQSGKEALSLLDKASYDLILLDVVMPDMDGYETCAHIQKDPIKSQIPIIFLTANVDEESIVKAFSVGGRDYISKPFYHRELLVRVKSALVIKEYEMALIKEVQYEKEKNEAKDVILLQQSRLAQMGEAFSMLTHQWKQPLSAVGLMASALSIKASSGSLTQEYIMKKVESIGSSIKFLSDTVSTFSSFFRVNANLEEVYFERLLDKTLLLIEPLIKRNDIKLNIELSEENNKVFFYVLINEIIQVMLVIIQNALDQFKIKEINGELTISFSTSETDIFVSIEDNAGGIILKNIDEIFIHHFTTKGINGSGIGLYMAEKIVSDHLNGSLRVENSDKGAKFTIKIPKITSI